MTTRKSISKTVRFEVFKRDSFTCQYCGKKAPECVLHVDHIHPVAKGGQNEILNLITSCIACNAGKGARTLDDATAVAKQHSQLSELQERREQIEMLMQWKTGLLDLADAAGDQLLAYFSKVTGWSLSDVGQKQLRLTLKKYPIDEVLAALDAAVRTYLKVGPDGIHTRESVGDVLFYIERIARSNRKIAEQPELAHIYHARAIGRKRCGYFKEGDAIALLQDAWDAGATADELRANAARCRSWTTFREIILDLTEKCREERPS